MSEFVAERVDELVEAMCRKSHLRYDDPCRDCRRGIAAIAPALARIVADAKAEALREVGDAWVDGDRSGDE